MQRIEAVTVLAFAKHHFDIFVHRPQNLIMLNAAKFKLGLVFEHNEVILELFWL